MLRIVFAVRDRAINAYMSPIAYTAEGQAIREFVDEVNRAESPLNKHPEDYDLYRLGTFDDNTARYTNEPEQPMMVKTGKDSKNATA